jgi:integrase
MIFIAMLLGLRPSEILGLRWDDVNFEKGILHVR